MAGELFLIESEDLPAELVQAINALVTVVKAQDARIKELEQAGGGMAPVVLARSGAGGLAAATNATTPRKGTAKLQVFNGTNLTDGPDVDYWNPWTGTGGVVGASKLLILSRAFNKHLFHTGEQC